MTVDLEVGHNEIGDADEPDFVSPEDANAVLKNLGFPPLGPIPVMALRHQIAQKLHAVSAPSSMRAHDLIDLQLLDKAYEGDYSDVRETCIRLFAYRKMQAWPPTIAGGEEWATIYADQLPDGNLILNVGDAISWANSLIGRIDAARQPNICIRRQEHAGTLAPDTAKHPGAAGNTPCKTRVAGTHPCHTLHIIFRS